MKFVPLLIVSLSIGILLLTQVSASFQNRKQEVLYEYRLLIGKGWHRCQPKILIFENSENYLDQLFITMDAVKLISGFRKDEDDFFFMMVWSKYDSNEYLVLPCDRSLNSLRDSHLRYPVLEFAIRNFKRFILKVLANYKGNKQRFLEEVQGLYRDKFYRLILFFYNFDTKKSDPSCIEVIRDLEACLDFFQSLITYDPEAMVMGELIQYLKQNPNSKDVDHFSRLRYLFYYFSQRKKDANGIKWLARQSSSVTFYYFLLQGYYFTYNGNLLLSINKDDFSTVLENFYTLFPYFDLNTHKPNENTFVVFTKFKGPIPKEILAQVSSEDELAELLKKIIFRLCSIGI